MVNGSLLINKEIGLTSKEEVNNVSKRLGQKKAGHIGTLDPFADGLLVVLLGSSTKISPFLEVMDKKYMATLKLGIKTNTGDLTGEVVEKKEIPELTKDKITDIFQQFLGKQTQIPPLFSAIKVNGQEMYKYARKGIEIERKPREITILSLQLVSYEKDEITFITKVSKGTYIRTLGEDIAEKLGTVGHLSKLTRLEVGPYSLEDAKRSNEVTEDDLLPIEYMLRKYKTFMCEGQLAKMALNGMHLRLHINDETILLKDKDGIIAIYQKESVGHYKCLRGLR